MTLSYFQIVIPEQDCFTAVKYMDENQAYNFVVTADLRMYEVSRRFH